MKLLSPSKYQPLACAIFESVSDELCRLLPQARIEHVGASSIPGAFSKGDLDICVVVAVHDHAATVQALQTAGYVIKANTLRTPELCMLLSPRKDSDVALQVVAEGSKYEFFMQFRDALRADRGLVESYNELKCKYSDAEPACYRAEKAKFIEAVLRAAIPSGGCAVGNVTD
jgi:GrpB-like predicted nucleotidyltransferase (UPF0157 family)